MWTQKKYEETVQSIYQRAAKDPKFRKSCLEQPHEVIREVSHLDVPDGVRIQFVDQVPDVQTYVLPPLLTDQQELSDEEVKQVQSVAVLWIVSGTPGSGFFIYRIPRTAE